MRLGLFGGTFDPPHIGHLIVAQDALAALRLDRILFIPARLPPHKAGKPLTPAPARLAMLEAAIAGDERFAVEPMELSREGPSYTVDTVAALRAAHPDADLFLLIGADQFREFATWREPERLAATATVCVLSRRGVEGGGASRGVADAATKSTADDTADDAANATAGAVAAVGGRYLPVTGIDISSTMIRARCRAGEEIRYLVPAGVASYLASHRLYDE